MKTNLYTNKKRWKWALAIIALLVIGASLWYTNRLVKSIAEQETRQVKMWAAAMEQHAVMMQSTEEFFNKVSEQEQLRVDLLANAYRRVIDISCMPDHLKQCCLQALSHFLGVHGDRLKL